MKIVLVAKGKTNSQKVLSCIMLLSLLLCSFPTVGAGECEDDDDDDDDECRYSFTDPNINGSSICPQNNCTSATSQVRRFLIYPHEECFVNETSTDGNYTADDYDELERFHSHILSTSQKAIDAYYNFSLCGGNLNIVAEDDDDSDNDDDDDDDDGGDDNNKDYDEDRRILSIGGTCQDYCNANPDGRYCEQSCVAYVTYDGACSCLGECSSSSRRNLKSGFLRGERKLSNDAINNAAVTFVLDYFNQHFPGILQNDPNYTFSFLDTSNMTFNLTIVD